MVLAAADPVLSGLFVEAFWDDRSSRVELSEILPEDRCLERLDELRGRWDAEALADPRFMVVDPVADEPLGRHRTPEHAVTLWSAVARALAAGG